jgi:hypothetical protein
MGEFGKGAGFLLATSLLALGASPALSDDLLVMPYACAIVGGRALLTAGENQGHRIIGAREQRPFRACSNADPTLCRQWTIHRFELDCEGTPVPWTSVVANARPDRAWLENGRLHVRMPPTWTLAADDPCAGGQRWRYGHLQRYCADRRALTPPASVEMPPGFAPMLGIDAIFVTPSAPKSAGQVAAYSSQPPPATPFSASVTPSANERQPSESPKSTVNAPPPFKEPIVKEPMVKEPMAKEPMANPDLAKAALTPATGPAPVVPRIINRPGAVAEAAPSVPATAAPAPSAPAAAAVPQTTTSVREAPPSSIVPETAGAATSDLSSRAAVAVIALLLVGLTSVILLLARGRRPRVGPNRDISRLSIGEPKRARAVARAEHATAGPSAIWSTAAGASPTWNEEVPQTRLEALRVLGMGVTGDANLAAIKKIVDGLRQTWHPDLARDPSEREIREKRMKQINVAWDILAAKPARL